MPQSGPKRLLGRLLFATANAVPLCRRWLAPWGRRTRPEWFDGRIVCASSEATGRRLRLASYGKNHLSFELFWRGLDYYEPLTAALLRLLAGPRGLFVDVGANVGFHTLMLGSVRPDLDIVAFEPHPELHPLLAANVAANRLGRVTVERCALSDREGTRPFFLHRSHLSASLEPSFDRAHAGVVDVPVMTLDAYLARRVELPGRFLLKLDVEGHEGPFLAGAEQTVRRHRPDIVTEAATPFPAETVEFLRRCGYRFRQISDEGLRPCLAPAAYVRGALVFLNCLLTTRSSAELEMLSAEIRAQARAIDLRLTSKLADPRVLRRFRDEPAVVPDWRRAPVPALLPGRWPNPQMK